ncbi:MAG: FYDLN acid domain-containing protein [Rhodobacteraceae bacterium]|nr:FYDLN acid domain-containing protein [Paracoccaceae bacterium]
MSKPEWGAKHHCERCDTRFYDLQRNPVICPNCQEPILAEMRPAIDIESIVADDEPGNTVGIDLGGLKTDDDTVLEDSEDVLDAGEEVSLDDISTDDID